MLALRHGKRAARGWLLPLLVAPFLVAMLSSCINQGEGCRPPENISSRATVWYASGRVYLFSPGATDYDRTSLYALRASDGKELWHAQGLLRASDADHLYLLLDPSHLSVLEALRASDGKVLWQSRQPVGFSTLGALDGSVYLYEDSDHALLALNAADGEEQWKIENTPLSLRPGATTWNVSIQVVNGIVYARSGNGVLSAFREEDGSPLWSHDFLGTFDAQSPWFIAQGMIYLSTRDNLFALRASDGQELWDFQGVDRGQENLLAVTVANGFAYLLVYEPIGQAGALLIDKQASDGWQLWQRALKQASGVLFADGSLYTGYGGDNLISYDRCPLTGPVVGAKLRLADGSQLWRFQSEE